MRVIKLDNRYTIKKVYNFMYAIELTADCFAKHKILQTAIKETFPHLPIKGYYGYHCELDSFEFAEQWTSLRFRIYVRNAETILLLQLANVIGEIEKTTRKYLT